MNVSAWSIRHPVPAILLFGWLTVLGLFSFHYLGIQNFPTVDIPIISVVATQEGMAPSQLESEVARKIEDAVTSLGMIEHIRTNVIDGSASVAIEFSVDKNAEVALNEVRNAVDSIRNDLPQELSSIVVSKGTTSGAVLLGYTIESPSMDVQDLSWFVDNDVSRALLAVPGVGKLTRVGGIDREVRVDLDPLRMAALGISAAEVSYQLKRVQQDASGGRSDVGGSTQAFRTLGGVGSIEKIAALAIPLADGRTVRLAEIARVSDGFAERKSVALVDGKPVVAFEIRRSKGTSEVEIAQQVRSAVEKFQAAHPQVVIKEAYNTFTHAYEGFQGSMQLLFEGAFLAVIVVWWFLRDWRATFVTTTALPLSVIPTFFGMKLLGFTLDMLTLLSLSLVVGILVDDAIVEIENIVRHLRMGKTPFHAAMEAADEIGMAVIATTLTLVAVFLPTAFIGGIPGKYFFPFGITASMAILASLVVARMLTPMMAAYLLKPDAGSTTERDSAMMTRYLGWVRWCLDHRWTTIGAAVVLLVFSLLLTPLLPTGFIPLADRGQINVTLELPPGSTIADTERTTLQAMELLRDIPEIATTFANVGTAAGAFQEFSSSEGNPDTTKSSLVVTLTPRHARKLKQVNVEDVMRTRLRALPGVRVSFASVEPGALFRVTLGSDDPVALASAIGAVERDLRTLKGVGNITSSASLQRPEIHVAPDFERAADLGVTAEALARAVRIATSGDYKSQLAKLNLPQRQVPIRLRLDKSLREDFDAIRQMPVAARGGTVPLEAIAEVRMGSGPAQIERMDRLHKVSFDVELGERILGDVLAEADALPALNKLPSGVIRMSDGGAEYMADLFQRFAAAIVIGVLCICIVLVLLFHDFLQPITILAALPLSLGGAFIALLVTNNAISMPSVFGILMLMGIVTKNSILLVDYTITARNELGLGRIESLVDACHKRARPILMTTIAMGAGMLPVALGLGAEPSFRAPMAIVVIGGLITSTLLSLLVIPVVYLYVEELHDLLRRLGQGIQRTPTTASANPAGGNQ